MYIYLSVCLLHLTLGKKGVRVDEDDNNADNEDQVNNK